MPHPESLQYAFQYSVAAAIQNHGTRTTAKNTIAEGRTQSPMPLDEFYGSSSEESTSPNNEHIFPDHVRVLLLDDTHRNALMHRSEDHGWDLPCFIYKSGIQDGDRIKRLCRQFSQWFGHDLHFAAVVELIGITRVCYHQNSKESFQIKLVVVELVGDTGISAFDLPDRAEWKDEQFLTGLVDNMTDIDEPYASLKRALECIEEGSELISSIDEPRLQFGWFNKASQFLASVMEEDGAMLDGPPMQVQMSLSSTVLVGSSTEEGDGYFLKAPVKGSDEVRMTETIAQLFEQTPRLVATSSELGCHVTREFEHAQVDEGEAVRVLGEIHLASLSYVDELMDAGCKVRDLDSIRDQIKRWADGCSTTFVARVDYLMRETAGFLMYLCRRLGELQIPLTLVHGDFAYREGGNTAYDPPNSKNVILFDWEYACISHPFLDFYRTRTKLSEAAIDEYLALWTDYGDLDTLREAFMYGSQLGRALRAWSLWDRAALCHYQDYSSLQNWMGIEISIMDNFARAGMATHKDYQSSPEAEMFK